MGRWGGRGKGGGGGGSEFPKPAFQRSRGFSSHRSKNRVRNHKSAVRKSVWPGGNLAGKQKDLGSIPRRVSFLFKI